MSNFESTSGNAGQVRFFNPGPVWVRPQVLQALTGPMLSHRSQAFMDLYGRILDKLPKVFRTAPGRSIFTPVSKPVPAPLAVAPTVFFR